MTLSELLVMLGRAWARLLIYPGGLAAFCVVGVGGWLWTQLQHRRASTSVQIGTPGTTWLTISGVVVPWLGIALLPLPLASGLARQTDILVVLALLEWPQLRAIQHVFSTTHPLHNTAIQRLAATLNGYPVLVLATLLLVQSSNSFEVLALTRAPGDLVPSSARLLHWLGAVAWALALPPLLGVGPFAAPLPNLTYRCASSRNIICTIIDDLRACSALQLGLRLRALGLVLLAALPWMGDIAENVALPRLLGATALLAALLVGIDHFAAKHTALRWAWAYLVCAAALLLALLWGAYHALQLRLE